MDEWLTRILTAVAALAAALLGLFSGVLFFGCGPRTRAVLLGLAAVNALGVGAWLAVRRSRRVGAFSLRAVAYGYLAGLSVGMLAP